MKEESQTCLTSELVLERYKFIQDKQKHLDSMLHTNISVYVKLVIALFTLIIVGVFSFKTKPNSLTIEDVRLLLELSATMLMFVSGLFLLMTLSNLFAWFGYRQDEVKLLEKFGGDFQRELPKKRSFYSWQETGFLLALSLMFLLTYVAFVRSGELSLLIV